MSSPEPTSPAPVGRADRRVARHRRHKWVLISLVVAVALVTAVGGALAAGSSDGNAQASAGPATRRATTTSTSTTTIPPTTTTTLPPLAQPPAAALPPFSGTLGPGSDSAVVAAYQQRLADLHFDPGPVDGNYGGATSYAVQALQKIMGLPRSGRIGTSEALGLVGFRYPEPLQPTGEPNRTEIDVTRQVLTLYENYQVRLITTTSTGSGEDYCYNSPRDNPTQHICEVATTPSGRFTYTRWVKGWDRSPLGQLYQPYYFNGGIAVHGYESVPPGPASHGCARIPMHIAEYYPWLVKVGDPVYVFGGTPAQILSSTPIASSSPPTTATTAPPVAPPPAPPAAPPSEPATPPAS